MNKMFREKLEKNWKKPYQYEEGHRQTDKAVLSDFKFCMQK